MAIEWIARGATIGLLASAGLAALPAAAQTETPEQIKAASNTCARSDDPDVAVAACNLVIANASRLNADAVGQAYLNRGAVYSNTHHFAEAIASYNQAVALVLPIELPGLYSARGAAYYRLGNMPQAIDDMQRAANMGYAKAAENLAIVREQLAQASAPKPAAPPPPPPPPRQAVAPRPVATPSANTASDGDNHFNVPSLLPCFKLVTKPRILPADKTAPDPDYVFEITNGCTVAGTYAYHGVVPGVRNPYVDGNRILRPGEMDRISVGAAGHNGLMVQILYACPTKEALQPRYPRKLAWAGEKPVGPNSWICQGQFENGPVGTAR